MIDFTVNGEAVSVDDSIPRSHDPAKRLNESEFMVCQRLTTGGDARSLIDR